VLFGWLTAALLRGLGATWRVEVLGRDPREMDPSTPPRAHLAALFHESLLPCTWLFRDRGYGVAVSRSRDGELVRSALLRLGYGEPARGSSSRGGSAAMRRLLRDLDAGTSVAVLVDGPRGPARVAKSGIVSIARRARIPIQPIAFSARPSLRLRSWDASLVPLPFARVICAFGEPLPIGPELDDAEEEGRARELERRLVELHDSADRALER
jgi:lysophospholipid acyltransferase (LPLAT)-like uncharacterized protein